MSSKSSGGGAEELYQSSLFRYTKAKPRKSATAAAPRKASSSFKDKTSSTSKPGASTKPGVARVHVSAQSVAPNPTSSFGGSSSVTSSELKENKAPNPGPSLKFASSSPIPGLSPSWDQRIVQREKRKAAERDPQDTGAQVSTPGFAKRKDREWEVEEHSGRVDGNLMKRRRRTSSSSSLPSHNQPSRTTKGESPCTPSRRDQQSTTTRTPPQALSSAVNLFNDDDDDIIDGSGVIESSQTQPLLSPERPVGSPPQANASSPQVSDAGIVRSSQSPSPLKMVTHYKTTMAVESTFGATPLKTSLYPSKTGPEGTEAPVPRRRRAPEPGTVSMFGVRGAGVSSPPELSPDIESPSTRALYSGVKRIRRPGRYSIPLSIDDKDPTTSHTTFESKQIQYSPLQARSLTTPSIAPVDQTSTPTPALESGGSSFNGQVQNQASDPGPFWETQPLLDLDFDEPLSPSASPAASPSPLPRMSLPPTSTYSREIQPANVFQAEDLANTSGSETEQDSPTPFLPPTRYNASSVDPDKTIVAFTPTRQKRGTVLGSEMSSTLHGRQSGVRATVLVPNSPASASDEWNTEKEEVGGDMTMVNHRVKTAVYPPPLKGKVQEGDIRDVTLGLEGLSPFKREQKHPMASKQMLRIQGSEVIVIEDDIDDAVGPSLSVGRLPVPQEETQDDQTYTQLWPGTSLPAGWNAFETPKKQRREPRFRVPNGSRSKFFERSITFTDDADGVEDWVQDEHDSDDVFGPEATPRTLQREKPDELKAFEALPSPHIGMFSGDIEGESESESEV